MVWFYRKNFIYCIMKLDINQEVHFKTGVYKIENTINKEFYIGSTRGTFYKRFKEHITDFYLWKNVYRRANCPILYNAFNKYGIENFSFSLIEQITEDILIRKKEEELIQTLNPHYNICKFPTQSGIPNLGRKLTDEWKNKIGEKAKLYKHKNNKVVYTKKVKQNKDLSSKFRLFKDSGEEFIGSAKECDEILGYRSATSKIIKGVVNRLGWKVERLTNQKKKIKLISSDEEIILDSFGLCNKFLNMWNGYTSEQVRRNKNKLLDYNYELLQ